MLPNDLYAWQAYGKTTYLITTLQRVPRGTEGAVSLEGSLAGLAAAFGFASLSYAIGQVGKSHRSHHAFRNDLPSSLCHFAA